MIERVTWPTRIYIRVRVRLEHTNWMTISSYNWACSDTLSIQLQGLSICKILQHKVDLNVIAWAFISLLQNEVHNSSMCHLALFSTILAYLYCCLNVDVYFILQLALLTWKDCLFKAMHKQVCFLFVSTSVYTSGFLARFFVWGGTHICGFLECIAPDVVTTLSCSMSFHLSIWPYITQIWPDMPKTRPVLILHTLVFTLLHYSSIYYNVSIYYAEQVCHLIHCSPI